ncbi:MAG: PilZ domain-containing protein [Granulosicoccus sp.]
MQDVKDKPSGHEAERRKFVRVQDALGLHVQRLVELPAAGQSGVLPTPSSVRKIDKYAIRGYADVRRDFPEVADYIGDLEERIRELLLDGDIASSKPTHKVSLSAGGLSFSDKTLFVPGEMISVTLTLFPTGRRIGTDAIIVSANMSDEVTTQDNPSYRAEFVRISDNDRSVIEKHVQQLLTKRPDRDYL